MDYKLSDGSVLKWSHYQVFLNLHTHRREIENEERKKN
jgi:hypothetical protein